MAENPKIRILKQTADNLLNSFNTYPDKIQEKTLRVYKKIIFLVPSHS